MRDGTYSDVIKLGGLADDVGAVLVVGEREEVLPDALVDVHSGSSSAALDELLDEVADEKQRRSD